MKLKSVVISFTLGLLMFLPPSNAIVNGQFLRGAEFRWAVVVFTGSGLCSGSLISPDWVLTAKHCFSDGDFLRSDEGELENLSVGVFEYPEHFDFERFQSVRNLLLEYGEGAESLDEEIRDFLVDARKVSEIGVSDDGDVALLRLSSPMPSVDNFPKVIDPEEAIALRQRIEAGDYIEAVAIGFGVNGVVGETDAVVGLFRKYMYARLLPTKDLLESLPGSDYFSDSTKDFISSAANRFSPHYRNLHYVIKDGYKPLMDEDNPHPLEKRQQAMIAKGDSGGPLMVPIQGEWKIVGVAESVSFSPLITETGGGRVTLFPRASFAQVDRFLCALISQFEEGPLIEGYEECLVSGEVGQ